MADKAPGGKAFDALMRRLVTVPVKEARQQERLYEKRKAAKKRKPKK